MKCPYNHKKIVQTTKSENQLLDEETGVCKGAAQVMVEEYFYCECVEDKCAAWYEGRCNFKG